MRAVIRGPTSPPFSTWPGMGAVTGLLQFSHQYSGLTCSSTVNGGGPKSTCWTSLAKWALRRRGPPQQGQPSRVCSKEVTISGGNRARSCLGCPGCPPGRRLAWPGGGAGGGGLTTSEEGGFEEVEESLR